MDFNDYQIKCKTTALYGDNIDAFTNCPAAQKLLRISYAGLGLGEVGELQNKLKKIIRDSAGKITEKVRGDVSGELGDILWYVAAMCSEFDLNMENVAIDNVNKLASRRERGVLQGSGDNR